jgi:hypothetical protein
MYLRLIMLHAPCNILGLLCGDLEVIHNDILEYTSNDSPKARIRDRSSSRQRCPRLGIHLGVHLPTGDHPKLLDAPRGFSVTSHR